MKRAATFVHRWRLRVCRDIQAMSWMEWAAIAVTVAAVAYFLSNAGVNWQSILYTIGMMAFGFMAASMIYDMWFGR